MSLIKDQERPGGTSAIVEELAIPRPKQQVFEHGVVRQEDMWWGLPHLFSSGQFPGHRLTVPPDRLLWCLSHISAERETK